jgi:hypothetical protein
LFDNLVEDAMSFEGQFEYQQDDRSDEALHQLIGDINDAHGHVDAFAYRLPGGEVRVGVSLRDRAYHDEVAAKVARSDNPGTTLPATDERQLGLPF